MTIAVESIRADATLAEGRLIPQAAQRGYVPATELAWLEERRQRHERLAERLAAAVLVPDRIRRDHDEHVAAWGEQVRAAARSATDPPPWSAQLSAAWLAGLIDAAEAVVAEIVEEVLQALADCETAFAGHAEELAALGLHLDGFDRLMLEREAEFSGEDTPTLARPAAWVRAVARWRERVRACRDVRELENYTRRRQERRPSEERSA
jgi:hypothetical protein